jgi:phosphomannomutase
MSAGSHFSHLESIYRNYDIRGRYPEEITEEEVEKIGFVIVQMFSLKKVAVGRDIRPSSLPLSNAMIKGLTQAGCDVVDLGLVTTPMTYYVCGSTDVDATVMVTASHMPSQYNGLKISIEDSKPVSAAKLQEIKKVVGEHTFSKTEKVGVVVEESPLTKWQAKFRSAHSFTGRPLKVVIDPANMIGALEIETFRQFQPELDVYAIYDTFDHTAPNHEANPIKQETMADLGVAVRTNSADIGISFDGDADRIGFVDETGMPVSADIIGALLARKILLKHQGAPVVFDTRSSKAVSEEIIKNGGQPVEWKVGHSNIRTKMREVGAVLGIELAAHYFFKDTYFSEGGALPAFIILELIEETGKSLSELVNEVKKYYHSGEINSEIKKSVDDIYLLLREKYADADTISDLDGLKFIYPTWWFNVRPSANDPVLRLNLEANTDDEMLLRRDEILSIIRS